MLRSPKRRVGNFRWLRVTSPVLLSRTRVPDEVAPREAYDVDASRLRFSIASTTRCY